MHVQIRKFYVILPSLGVTRKINEKKKKKLKQIHFCE